MVIAPAHDVVITMGVLSLFHIEIDLTIVASLMSVIGYSLNDSIVVSDRIRENFRKIRRGTPYEIFNVSLTQTLHRTLITSGTTLMVILMLFLFGGPILEGFADHADRCFHRYGFLYLRRLRAGVEAGHEARASDPAEG